MTVEQHQGGTIIVLTFFLALMLAVVPLPDWAAPWRPEWVAMVLLYWSIALPQRVGVATGWLVGILHDVLSATLLGQHALVYVVLAYLGGISYHRVRLFLRWQQAIWVGVLVLLGQLIGVWLRGIQGYPPVDWSFTYPAVTSLLLWRWTFVGLRDLRRFYRVS
jgi:rod shape-determining protein MreD